MATTLNRRDFIKYAGGGIAAIVVGSKLRWMTEGPLFAAPVTQTIVFRIQDAMKQMVTHNSINNAECYFWVYKATTPAIPAECPAPNIFATKGDTIDITVFNDLDEPHAFFVPGMFDSGPIAPGASFQGTFVASQCGAHLYYDNLNEPVNRVMGLHGALIILPDPAVPVPGHNLTPYNIPSTHVQEIFDAFGSTIFPGLKWEEGDAATGTTPFRSYTWIMHQASPNLFAEVGASAPGAAIRQPANFMNAFLNDPFSPTNASRTPQYFTIQGQSGHFAHNSPFITPMVRVGEPVIIHILNAGLWTHSLHLHANHFYITSHNLISNPSPVANPNPIWVDVYTIKPMNRIDYVYPFMRTPDVPNQRGIGRPDAPLATIANPLIAGSVPHTTWPPTEELNTFIPDAGTVTGTSGATVSLRVRLSPLCYPVHDHSEPSQTAQGGNYNCGVIVGVNFIGDRNLPGGVVTFPDGDPAGLPPTPEGIIEPMSPPNATGPAAPFPF